MRNIMKNEFESAIPLLQMKDINWVVINKDVSKNELKILKSIM